MRATPSLARRARPLLGTLVEIAASTAQAAEAGFEAVDQVQRLMSRFDPSSEVGRFNAQGTGRLQVHPWTAEVLQAASDLQQASEGAFDACTSTGRSAGGWRLEGLALVKLREDCRLDLGGIAKGFAVDRAVSAMQQAGAASGWVNAGGDLRVFGELELPVQLRDEAHGGVRHFGHLAEGALATSRLLRHVSVAAPLCVWADALTKVVAATGRADHPLLARHGAIAWVH